MENRRLFSIESLGYLWCKLVCTDKWISVLWVETIHLSFFEPFLRQFWIFWKLKITYFTLIAAQKHHDFPLKSSHFESPQFSSSPTVTSLVLFPTIYRQLSRPLYDYEGQKVALFTCHYLCDPKSNWLETSEYVYLIPNQHITSKSDWNKNVEILVFLTFNSLPSLQQLSVTRSNLILCSI